VSSAWQGPEHQHAGSGGLYQDGGALSVHQSEKSNTQSLTPGGCQIHGPSDAGQTLASTAYIDPSLVSGGLTMSNPRYLTSAQSIACPTGDCYDYDVGVRGVRNQLIVR